MILAKEILLLLISCAITHVMSDDSFYSNFYSAWGANHLWVFNGGRTAELSLNPSSGTGFSSKNEYCNGVFRMNIKIPPQKTSGIIISFYLISKKADGNHDELDFEFFGTKGYLQTNIFAGDSGHREERINLWFDPSKDFHTYEIDFNSQRVVFRIDNSQVRVFPNNGGNYITKPLRVQASIWNASWAGNVDWNVGPFKAYYQGFFLQGTICRSW